LKPAVVNTFKSLQQFVSKADHFKGYKNKQEATVAPCVPYLGKVDEKLG
jgi:hypothetical protein